MRDTPITGKFRPTPIGGVRLVTRSSTRSRLHAGGTFFRSKDRGEQANLIKIGVFEETVDDVKEGMLVVHNTALKLDENFSTEEISVQNLELYRLQLAWDKQIELSHNGTEWRAELQGISRRIAPTVISRQDLGAVRNGILSQPEFAFKIMNLGTWPTTGTVLLKPRLRRYALESTSATDPLTMLSTTGWSISDLRVSLNGDDTCWVTMPGRAVSIIPPFTGAEDKQDSGTDAPVLSAFPMTSMSGGDGLPITPVGFNTGPERVLVHLNYAENDDGSMGVLNQVFEWQGDSATIGAWQRYS